MNPTGSEFISCVTEYPSFETVHTGAGSDKRWNRFTFFPFLKISIYFSPNSFRCMYFLICWYCFSYRKSMTPLPWLDGHLTGVWVVVVESRIVVVGRAVAVVVVGLDVVAAIGFCVVVIGSLISHFTKKYFLITTGQFERTCSWQKHRSLPTSTHVLATPVWQCIGSAVKKTTIFGIKIEMLEKIYN